MDKYVKGVGGKKTKNGEKYYFEFQDEFWLQPGK